MNQSDRYVPKYFAAKEFKNCTPSCDILDMNDDFLRKLDHLRQCCGFPLMLTCAYRSPEYDRFRGRDGSSYHCKGRAVDIYCVDSHRRWDIVHAAVYCGLSGVGIGKNFIHVDDRVIQTLWHYYD